MALDNYANLKAAIENWSHRGDVKGFIDDFIALTEIEMYSNPDAILRLRSMWKTVTLPTVVTNDFVTLPADFLESRRISITIDGIERPMSYKTPEQMNIDLTREDAPYYFTIEGGLISFDVLPDDIYDIKLDYFAKLTPLSDAAPVNVILTDHPNIYLYGALRALQQYAMNAEEEALNYSRFIKAIQGANTTDRKGRYGPAPRQRLRGATP
jgi:hypothetical protein